MMRVAVPSRCLILIVVVVTLSAPIVQWIAPRNDLIFSDSFARSSTVATIGLREPADSIMLAFWLLFSATVLVVLVHRTCRLSRWLSREPSRFEFLLGVTSAAILGLQIFLPLSSGQQVNIGITPWWSAALIALVIAASRTFPLTNYRKCRVSLSITLVILLAVLMFQTPYSIADPYHFSFVGNELLSVAAGEIPLGGVVHSYTNVLPFLVAPLLIFLPMDPVRIVLIDVLLLQIVVLGVAGHAIRRTVKSDWIRATSYLLLAGTSVALHPYIQTFPVRYWLPFVCFLAFSKSGSLGSSPRLMAKKTFLVGFVSVLLVINNADFGAAGASALTLLTAVETFASGRRVRGWLSFAWQWLSGSSIGLFLILGVLYACGSKPALHDLLIFPNLFGLNGYFREPMALFEPSVILIVIATSGLACATCLLSRGSPSQERGAYWLFVMSCFVIVSSSYPMGRSFQSTFVSLAIPSIVVSAILLDHLLSAIKDQRLCTNDRLAGSSILSNRIIAAVAFLGVFFLAGQAIGSVSRASVSFWWTRSSQMHVVESELRARDMSLDELGINGDEAIGGQGTRFEGQALVWSNYFDLEIGAESVAVSSHPEMTALSMELSLRQCAQNRLLGGAVLLDTLSHNQIGSATSCLGGQEAGEVHRGSGNEIAIAPHRSLHDP